MSPAHAAFAGDAESLPFPVSTFDTTVDTFGLCVVSDPLQALKEMARVTKPQGQVLLLEHTRSHHAAVGRYQDITAGPVAALGKGCMWNQDVLSMVSHAGLQVQQVQHYMGATVSAIAASKSNWLRVMNYSKWVYNDSVCHSCTA